MKNLEKIVRNAKIRNAARGEIIRREIAECISDRFERYAFDHLPKHSQTRYLQRAEEICAIVSSHIGEKI